MSVTLQITLFLIFFVLPASSHQDERLQFGNNLLFLMVVFG
jgi:hypothetical protein